MNRVAGMLLLSAMLVGLVPTMAFAQAGGGALQVTFQNQATDPPGPLNVVAGLTIALGFTVEGGTPPYTVALHDDGTVDGGTIAESSFTGDGPDFQFDYKAPRYDVGDAGLTVNVADATGAAATLSVLIPVICPGLGLCTDRLTNQELGALNVLDFELQMTQTQNDGTILVVDPGTIGTKLFPQNLAPANVLNRLDVDRDGAPDNVGDTDGDGLPDNWELGGTEAADRVVFFPAPSAIVPGTPPTPIFTRRAVATSALLADTDGDGLSDFSEVFGLKYIDEDGDGRLDQTEWMDFNQDGMPSVGEYPIDNVERNPDGSPKPNVFGLLHDFDGFVFTDPANPDTDGDGIKDGADVDPLINPRSFGNTSTFFARFNRAEDPDIDKDGIGNGMDMGNDIVAADSNVPGATDFQGIDNPANMRELLDLFRDDLLGDGVVPEAVVEDILGADWDGNGLWRTTDIQNWLVVVDPDNQDIAPPSQFFDLDSTDPNAPVFFSTQRLHTSELTQDEIDAGKVGVMDLVNSTDYKAYNGRGIGLGWQDVLRPPSSTEFMPDRKIWAILYAWRVPGFDIDGDGFVGIPDFSLAKEFQAADHSTLGVCEEIAGPIGLEVGTTPNVFDVLVVNPAQGVDRTAATPTCPDPPARPARPFDDRIKILPDLENKPGLDGVIDVPGLTDFVRLFGCGSAGTAMLSLLVLGLGLTAIYRRR